MKKKKKAGICSLPKASQTPPNHPLERAELPQSQTLSSIAVKSRKTAKNRLGTLREEGTANRKPAKSAHTKPVRKNATAKKFVSVKSILSLKQLGVRWTG